MAPCWVYDQTLLDLRSNRVGPESRPPVGSPFIGLHIVGVPFEEIDQVDCGAEGLADHALVGARGDVTVDDTEMPNRGTGK